MIDRQAEIDRIVAEAHGCLLPSQYDLFAHWFPITGQSWLNDERLRATSGWEQAQGFKEMMS